MIRALVLTVALLCAPALAWGPEGHRVVASVAAERLTPNARANVDELLKGHSMASVSRWADQVRTTRPQSAPWHYVDIPLKAAAYDARRDCRRGCIVEAINREFAALRDPRTPAPERVQALMWLIHLVGDASQPLHDAERDGDKGGNTLGVTFYGRPENLHQVWDSGLLAFSGETEGELVAELSEMASNFPAEEFTDRSAEEWVNQAHQLARAAYSNVPANGELLTAYEDTELPVAKLQLARAGARLAAVLNAVFQ